MNKKSELQKTMFGSTLWNIWIWLTIVLVVLADVNVVVSLGIEGVVGWHLVIPIVFLALDVILALVAAFSNFRFRYSLVFPIIYAAFTVVIGIVGIVVYCAVLDYIVFTSFALISWMIFELLSVATILLSTIRASGKGLVFSIITVVLVVIFAAYSIFYVVIVAQDGFFGQGKSGSYSSEERTTTYRYDEETDTYIATGTLSGRGGTVLISDSVNGKKVGEVDCSIFLGDGISCARLLCDGDVKFSNTECIADLPDDFTVTASSDSIDGFKTYFYELSVETTEGDIATYDARTDALRDAYADFANRITPEVENGEVYIVFTYGYGDLQTLGVGNVLPTWISEKSDTFSVSDLLYGVEDTFMYENMDPSKEDNLYYYYTNYGKIILNELCDSDGNPIEGQSITSSVSVGVSYETIYAVSISTNDTVYAEKSEFIELSQHYDSSEGYVGYRYVIGSSANSLISAINETANARAGFTYKWTYNDGKTLGSLENVIEDGMEISLDWTLDAPEISMASTASGIYGDVITLAATSISHGDSKNISDYTYSWTLDGTSVGSSSSLAFNKALPSDSGIYTLTVTASPSDTSLTSFASASVSLSISKKTLSFEWFLDEIAIEILTAENRTYSGVDKKLTSAASGVLDDDTTFSYTQSTYSVKDAQTYSFYATLDGDWGEYYEMDGTYSASLTISPYELTIDWVDADNLNLTYDGNDHDNDITYTLTGFDGDDLGDSKAITQSGVVANVHDAGNYVATVTIENGNYTLSNPTLNFSVAKATLTVASWATETFTYDGTVHVQKVAVFYGRVGEDNLGESYAIGGDNTAGVNAGSYTSTVSISNANYNLTGENLTQSYTIEKATLTVARWADETFTYDGEVHVQKVATFSGVVGEDDLGESYAIDGDNTEGINAGSYTSTVSISNGNYELTGENLTESYTIAKRQLSVSSWSESTHEYDGSAHRPEATLEEIVAGDNIEITYSISGAEYGGSSISGASEVTNAGTYTVSISISEDNYELASTYTCSYTITKRVLTVSEWGETSHVYDGVSYHPNATLETIVGGDNVVITYSISGTENSGATVSDASAVTNAGTYTVSISINEANYELADTYSCIYTITPLELTVSWVDNLDLTYDGQNHDNDIIYTVVGLGGDTLGDSVAITKGGVAASVKDAGDYVATVTITNENYTLKEGTDTFSFTVAKRQLTVSSWGETSLEYDGSAHCLEATLANIVEGDEVQITYSISGTEYSGATVSGVENVTNAGTYTVSISISEANYELAGDTSSAYTITKRQLTASSWGKTSLEYDGSAHCLEATLANIVEGDEVQITYSISGTEYSGATVSGVENVTNAGTYTVSISINEANYELADIYSCSYTITPITVSISWNICEFTYNGESQHPEATITGVLDADKTGFEVTYSVTGEGVSNNESVNVGEYTVTITGINNSNYALPVDDSISASYKIVPITLTITWAEDDAKLTYIGDTQHPEATFVGVLEGEDVGDVEYSISVTTEGDSESKIVGAYTVTVKSISNGNYALPAENDSSLSFDYTITPIIVEVSWSDDDKELTYTGSAQHPEASFGNVLTGESVGEVVYTIAIVTDGNSIDSINVGKYTVTVSSISNANYALPTDSSVTFEYEIIPIVLTVSWTPDSFTYTGSQQYPTAAVTGELVENEANISYSIVETDGINVGEYTVTMVIGNSNYTAAEEDLTKTFTITAAGVSVASWDETPLIYSGSQQYPTVTAFSGVFGSDNLNPSYSVTDGNGKDAGTHTVTVTINNSNYTLTGDATWTYTIAPITLGVTWNDGTYTYNGTLQYPTATVSGVLSEEDAAVSYMISEGNGIDAGSHTVQIVVGNTNYTVAENDLTKNFTISTASLAISSWDNTTLAYTGSMQYPEATFYEVFSQDGVTDDLQATYTVTSGDGINAGSHTVTVTIGNTNYSLTGSNSNEYAISPITLTIVWNEGALTYNGTQQHPDATITGELSNGDANISYSVNNGDGIYVGTTYTVTMTIGNSNYTAAASDLSKEFEISAAEISVASWDETPLTYSGSVQYPTVMAFSGVFGSDNLNPSYSVTEGTGTNAGTHTVTVTISNSNYTLTGDATHEYTIAQKTITVSWNVGTYTYNGNIQNPTVTLSGEIASGDASISYSISAGNGIDAGEHTVTLVIGNSNYTASNLECTYTIAKASVSVAWAENDSTASFTCNGSAISADVAGITCTYYVYDENETGWTETEDITKVGTYYAVLSIAEDGNYEFASGAVTEQTFTVV